MKPVELRLLRTIKTGKSTIGELYINGEFQCYILEDTDRMLTQLMSLKKIKELKEYGKTAIPRGKYEVVITFSNRFKKYLPILINVPGFTGIRIHPGNQPKDTEGCLLPGAGKGRDFVNGSRGAFEKLFKRLQAAVKTQKVYIEIV